MSDLTLPAKYLASAPPAVPVAEVVENANVPIVELDVAEIQKIAAEKLAENRWREEKATLEAKRKREREHEDRIAEAERAVVEARRAREEATFRINNPSAAKEADRVARERHEREMRESAARRAETLRNAGVGVTAAGIVMIFASVML